MAQFPQAVHITSTASEALCGLPLRLLRHFRLQNCLWRSLESTLRRNQFTRSMHHVSQNLL